MKVSAEVVPSEGMSSEGSVPGLSPWLADGCLLPVSSHHLPNMRVRLQISSYKDTSHIGLGHTLMISL